MEDSCEEPSQEYKIDVDTFSPEGAGTRSEEIEE
jgi:hypothetical protein